MLTPLRPALRVAVFRVYRRWNACMVGAFVFAASACTNIAPPAPDDGADVVNTCTRSADCAEGSCSPSQGVCSAPRTTLGALLVEVTPPATETGFGGFRLLRSHELTETVSDVALVVREPPRLRGDIRLSFADASCRPSPVEVTFTPVEAYLGMETLRYSTLSEVGTEIVDKQHRDTHRYALSGLPDGVYDIYVEDAGQVDNSATPGCAVAPQVFRGQTVTSEENLSRLRLDLIQPQVRSLRVLVPWPSALEGWEVDVVHPITGERLSSRAVLSADRLEETSQGEQFAVADLRVSEVRGTDFVGPNQEQLRLRHPTDVGQPSILMMLAGLEVFQRGEALVPRLQALASQVNYELWVWTSPDGGAVEGKVSFSALELDEIPVGVTGRLQTSVKIGAQGLVSARLPPGTYRVRVDPSLASGRSSVETTVTVWPPLSDDAGSQGGQVLIAPETATVGGDVVFLRSNPPTGTSVRLTGARDATRPSASQRPFFPRSVDTLIEGRVFELTGVDCGSCNAALGALYTLRVAPPEKTGLPWWVGLGLTVSRPDVRLEPIQLNVPVLQPGRLEFQVGGDRFGFPRALLRVFALLDQHGAPARAASLPICSRLSPDAGDVECLSRAVEVATTRTGADGSFQWLLPQRLERLTALDVGDAGAP